MILKGTPVGVELVKRGVVTSEDIEKALMYQRENPSVKLGDALYELNVCEPETLIRQLGDIIGENSIILSKNTINVNPTEYIALDIAKKIKCVPFESSGGRIKVCFGSTSNSKEIENIRLILLNKGLVMDKYITFSKLIEDILNGLEGTSQIGINEGNLTGTIISLVDTIIKTAITRRASDIHIEPLENIVQVRYRIDGQLYLAATIDKEKQNQVIGRLKAISNMHQEKTDSQDGRILAYPEFNMRVSSQNNIYGEKFVIRLLKKNSSIRNIFELGFSGTAEEFNKYVNKRNSITVVAAPTGEGKTTTLYSIIDTLNEPNVNITTIEDPVEIRIGGLNQIEIDAKSTFANSLRTVLRQDPDVVLVGEIRDKDTAEIAIQAGQTGHYVLSTIHTIDAIEVINRLRKIGISNYDISSTLATTISQRLVRRLCPDCKKEREITKEEKEIMKKILEKYGEEINIEEIKLFDKCGCEKCNNTGFYERIAVFEILDIDDEIKELIVDNASTLQIRKKALESNYRPLVVDGIKKVLKGYTTLEELNNKLLFY